MPPARRAGRLAALLVLPLVLVAASGEPTPASRPTSEPAEATPAIAARQAAAASAPAPALPHAGGLVALAGLAVLGLLHAWRVRVLAARWRRRAQAQDREHERGRREREDRLLDGVAALTLQVRAAANQVPEGSAPRERLELALRRASRLLDEAHEAGDDGAAPPRSKA